MFLTIVFLATYILALIGITVVSSRRQTDNEYINSAKNLSATESMWTTFALLLTGYNFVIGITFSYLYGFWYLMVFVGAGLEDLIDNLKSKIRYITPKYKENEEERQYVLKLKLLQEALEEMVKN